jgi:hypothetical protein
MEAAMDLRIHDCYVCSQRKKMDPEAELDPNCPECGGLGIQPIPAEVIDFLLEERAQDRSVPYLRLVR